jgi:hypothetical protein
MDSTMPAASKYDSHCPGAGMPLSLLLLNRASAFFNCLKGGSSAGSAFPHCTEQREWIDAADGRGEVRSRRSPEEGDVFWALGDAVVADAADHCQCRECGRRVPIQ